MMRSNRWKVLALLAIVGAACGCGIGTDSPVAATSESSNPSTAAQFNSQFIATKTLETNEPDQVSTLDLDGLPQDDTTFDTVLGN